jgi:hypothetical protein
MNNVDIATTKIRQLQQALFDPSKSPNDLFAMTNDILKSMELASKEINTNYETVSRKLTDLMNGNPPKNE